MRQRAHIGKTADKRTVVIEQGLVDRFVKALEIDDPLCRDKAAAKKAGLRGMMLPRVGISSLGQYNAVFELLELRPKQVLHSKESVSIYEPLCVGDEVTVETVVGDLYEQTSSGNPMGFVTINVYGRVGKTHYFDAVRIIAVRGGFSRR